MRKKPAYLTIIVLFLCMIFAGKVNAAADETSSVGKITLSYEIDGIGFENLEVSLYQVASLKNDGTFELLPELAKCSVSTEKMLSSAEQKNAASTLEAFLAANQIKPKAKALTDKKGDVLFENLQPGLYFVQGIVTEKNGVSYEFRNLFIPLPIMNADGSLTYEIKAKPKYELYAQKADYKVVKLWKDQGYKEKRPKEIQVEIFKDGSLERTVVLNADNDWSYQWEDSEGKGKWTVSEKNPGKDYKVEILSKENVFQIINTYEKEDPSQKEPPKTPDKEKVPPSMPKTGDEAPVLLYVMVLCISGCMLLVIGNFRKRKKSG